MDFSKLKLEVYDLLGVILPGLLGIFGVWVLLKGWMPFVASLHQLNGTELTVLLIVAFGAGNLLQELGDSAVKTLKGKRFSRKSRDDFWSSDEALPVRAAITSELGQELIFVDTAFDYCLTRLKDRFAKRDMFLATSDLCRSLWLLAFLAFVPATRIAWEHFSPTCRYFAVILGFVLFMFSLHGCRGNVWFASVNCLKERFSEPISQWWANIRERTRCGGTKKTLGYN